MHLSERAILKPRLIILGAAVFMGIGVLAVISLPKEMVPRIKLPVIVVAVPNYGAQPSLNEREIVRKIEDNSAELEDLRSEGGIYSQAVDGAGIVQFIFEEGISVESARRDVESLINRVKGQFPEDAQRDPGPTVHDVAFDDMPIIQVFVAGGEDGKHRRRIAEKLQDRIEALPGIASVSIFGGLEREIHIEVHPHAMNLYGLTYDDLAEAVRRGNQEAPSGALEPGTGSDRRVRVQGKVRDLEEIRNLSVSKGGEDTIRLREVATVTEGTKPRESIATYGGEEAAVLLVKPKTDIDVMQTADRIQAITEQFVAEGENEGTHVGAVRSQARFIRYMLNQLGTSALYGTILVVVLLWIFMGWRNAGLISASVPFAIVGTAAMMWLAKKTFMTGLAINNMTLFATILVVGMVVDGCIIVGENIYRHRQLGKTPVGAAQRGIREVGGSLMSAYLTTFAAFAPMFLVSGVMGDFMELLPIVVLFALVSAMLVDHFLLPVLSVYIMKARKSELEEAAEAEASDQEATAEDIEIRGADRFVSRSSVARVYGRMIRYALHHRMLVLALALLATLTPVGLFMVGAIGKSFFPESDMAIVEVTFDLPLGSSMERRTRKVGEILEGAVNRAVLPDEWYRPSEKAERVKAVTTIGQAGALNTDLKSEAGAGPEFGMVYIELELAEHRNRTVKEIREAIGREIEQTKLNQPELAGVNYKVTSPKEGPPAGATVLVRVLGREATSLDQLARRAREIEQMLRAVPGTIDITNDHRVRPQLDAEPKTEIASLYDITKDQISRSVNFALQGMEVGKVDFGSDDEIDLRVRNLERFRDDFHDLEGLPLIGDTGRQVTLGEVSKIEPVRKANVIRRYDKQRVINIRCDLVEGVNTDRVKEQLIAALNPQLNVSEQRALVRETDNRMIFNDDEVVVEFGGETEMRDDAFDDLAIALLVAFGSMLIILVFKFNSFSQSLIVLFSVPLSLVGVFIGLTLCGFDFSVSAMIGVVALAGIVVNDAIVLVDFINRMRKLGVPMEQAVIYAGQLRIRPIFLTTITTISGMLPLALNIAGGGEFWQPLTVTVMFGLAFATLLQLFVVPIACFTFDRSRRASVLDPERRPDMVGAAATPAGA